MNQNGIPNNYVGLRSNLMPDIPRSPSVTDLFANFALNWKTLWPVLTILFGIIFFGWLLKKIKDKFWGDDD